MAISQNRSKRSTSGTKYDQYRKKKKHELGREPSHTKVADRKLKSFKTIGNNRKYRLLSAQYVNLADPKTKKVAKVKILNVVENPANRHFVRRNILTKGTVVETEKGKARINSRPGQEGSVNAVLV